MIRKISVILAVVLIASIPFAAHGGRLSYKGTFAQGSLKADGTFTGVGNADVLVKLEAFGTPVVTCTNQGGNEAPGQNPSQVTSTDTDNLGAVQKNGKAPYHGVAPNPTIQWFQGGCPSANWTARVDGVLWDKAVITVNEGLDGSGAQVFKQTFCLKSTSIVPGTSVQIVACPAAP